MTITPDLPILLLPVPRLLNRTGGWIEISADPASIGVLDAGSQAHPQGYTLSIGERSVDLRSPTPIGLRHGRATLAQLVRQFGRRLPCLEIEDSPSFATRGFMLDISRDKVPTMDSLRETIDLLASLKFNHLQLYTEHTFAYAGHEPVWRDASPITPDEARELDGYCRERGIDLAANQNCFGHLRNWLQIEPYSRLAETHGEWKFLQWDRRGPFSLCPIDPGSIALIRDLLGQLLPCFTSSLVNINCDETFDVGQGRSKAEVERRGAASVYFEFVHKVCAEVQRLGKRPMMWADIALSHPESLGMFPKDAIGLAWGYEPDAAFGAWCGRLREHGIEAWVCPGTSSWRSITGRTTESRANMRAAAEQGLGAGATGYLVTDWGDTGHHQHWPITMNALAHAAQAAWNSDRIDGLDPRAVSMHAIGQTGERLDLASWLDALGDIELPIRRIGAPDRAALRNNGALFLDLYRPAPYDRPIDAPLAMWRGVEDRLEEMGRTRPSGVTDLVRDELRHTLAVAGLAAEHAIAERDGTLARERVGLVWYALTLVQEHERLWMLRNRRGGLMNSSGRYMAMIDRIAGKTGAARGGGTG